MLKIENREPCARDEETDHSAPKNADKKKS